jgi:ribosomal-protein-alanine N-acetyltransferase
MPFPIIEIDKQYILREIDRNNKEIVDFFNLYQNELVKKFLPDNFIVNNFTQAKENLLYIYNLFYKKEGIFWAIAIKENNKIIGTIGLNNINTDHSRATLGCDLDYSYWGKGIMSRALLKVIEYSFKQISLNRLEAFVESDNHRSIELFKRLSFTQEGILRDYEIRRRKYKDCIVFGYTRKDFIKSFIE